MAGKKNNSKAKQQDRTRQVLLILPLAAVMGIVPLIVFLHEYDNGLTGYSFFGNNDETYDFFLYHKMVWFIVFATIMACIAVVRLARDKKQIKFTKVFIPLGVYALLAIISTIFSEHPGFGFTGIYEQFESLPVLLGYAVVTYYAYLYINDEQDLKTILKLFTAFTIVMLLIGVSQALKFDIYRTDAGKHLILPHSYFVTGEADSVTFNFELGRVYLSLYNPNYVGSYVALISPLFLMLAVNARKYSLKIFYGIMYVGLLLTLLGSQSRAGFVGVAASLILLIVVFNKKLLKNWIPVAVVLVGVIGLLVWYEVYSNGAISSKFRSAFNTSVNAASLKSMETTDDGVRIKYEDKDFVVWFDMDEDETAYNFKFGAYDTETGREFDLVPEADGWTYMVYEDGLTGFELYPVILDQDSNTIGFTVKVDDKEWYFGHFEDGYFYYTIYGKLIKLVPTETVQYLEDRAQFASGRGFIWARTLPLLKKYFLIGSGADTFIFAFPNADFVAMYTGGYDGMIITKPHNMYLQMGVQTGLVSVIAFLVFYAMYFFSSMALYIRRKKLDFCSMSGIGILCGSFGYMAVQIINDSSITVAPIYWAMMGIGLAVNAIVKLTPDEGQELLAATANTAAPGRKTSAKQ